MANTTWSTTDKGSASLVLSNGNLTVTASGSVTANLRGVDRLANTKFYFEQTFNTISGVLGAGVANVNAILTSGNFANTAIVTSNTGNIWLNGVNTSISVGTPAAGTVVGIAVDLVNLLIWFRLGAAGNWNGNAAYAPGGTGGQSLAAFLGGPFPAYPYAAFNASSVNAQLTANFGNTAFTGAVPAGFTSGFTAGSAPPLAALATSVAAEEWAVGTPDLQATQLAVEQWAVVALGNPQLVATQIAVEQWSSVAAAVAAQRTRVMVLA